MLPGQIIIKDNVLEIWENDKCYRVEICRNTDGTIWGVYPNRTDSVQDDIIFANAMRNLLILFKEGKLKLEDFPREVLVP